MCSVHRRVGSSLHLEDILSTLEGYLVNIRGCSIHLEVWGILWRLCHSCGDVMIHVGGYRDSRDGIS